MNSTEAVHRDMAARQERVIGIPERLLFRLVVDAAMASGYLRRQFPDKSDQVMQSASAVAKYVAEDM